MEFNDNFKAVAENEGKRIARGVFALRGNNTEAHISEVELAGLLGLAVEHGIKAVIHGILKPNSEKQK